MGRKRNKDYLSGKTKRVYRKKAANENKCMKRCRYECGGSKGTWSGSRCVALHSIGSLCLPLGILACVCMYVYLYFCKAFFVGRLPNRLHFTNLHYPN